MEILNFRARNELPPRIARSGMMSPTRALGWIDDFCLHGGDRGRKRQPDGKLATQAWLALDFQPASVGIDQVTSNTQSQTHTLGNAPLIR
jgi:hypothetical protein